jgi:hypothetical protein
MNDQLQRFGLFIVASDMIGLHWGDLIVLGMAVLIVVILVFGLRALIRWFGR